MERCGVHVHNAALVGWTGRILWKKKTIMEKTTKGEDKRHDTRHERGREEKIVERRTVPCGVFTGVLAEAMMALIGKKKSSVAAGWRENAARQSLTLFLSLYVFFFFYCFFSVSLFIFMYFSLLFFVSHQGRSSGFLPPPHSPFSLRVCLRAWWFRVSLLRIIRSFCLLGNIYIYNIDIFILSLSLFHTHLSKDTPIRNTLHSLSQTWKS